MNSQKLLAPVSPRTEPTVRGHSLSPSLPCTHTLTHSHDAQQTEAKSANSINQIVTLPRCVYPTKRVWAHTERECEEAKRRRRRRRVSTNMCKKETFLLHTCSHQLTLLEFREYLQFVCVSFPFMCCSLFLWSLDKQKQSTEKKTIEYYTFAFVASQAEGSETKRKVYSETVCSVKKIKETKSHICNSNEMNPNQCFALA